MAGRPAARPCSASAVRSSSRPTVWITRGSTSTWSNGRHGVSTSSDPSNRGRDLGQLGVGADREGVDAEPLRLAGQPAQPEAVAVALGHRDEPGVALEHVLEVGAPAVAVDVQGQGHGSAPPPHVEVEGLVDEAVQRQVPLPGVLHGLAAGADLELDQPDVGVLGVEGVGDAAQVVDVRRRPRASRGSSATGRRWSRGRRASRWRRRRRSTRCARPRGSRSCWRPGRPRAARGRAGSGRAPRRPAPRTSSRSSDSGRGVKWSRSAVCDVELVEGLQVGGRRRRSTSTPALAGLLDVAAPLLVHALEDVVLGARVALGVPSGIQKLYCGWPAAKPPLDRLGAPAELAQLGDDAGADLAPLGGRHAVSECTASSAMPSLTWAALQRRVTTGGPIRMPKAPWPRRCAAIGSSQAPEVLAVPVDERTLGQVGEVALDPGQLAVEHQRGADELVAPVADQPIDSALPLRLHRRPRRGLQEARRRRPRARSPTG